MTILGKREITGARDDIVARPRGRRVRRSAIASRLRGVFSLLSGLVIAVAVGGLTVVLPGPTALLAIAVIGLALAWFYLVPAIRAKSGIAILLAAIIITVFNATGTISSLPFGQYLPVAFVGAVYLLIGPRSSAGFRAPSVVAGVICVLGIGGSIIGRLFLGNADAAFRVLIPLLLVALPTGFSEEASSGQIRRWAKWGSYGCSLIMVMIGVAYTYPAYVTYLIFNHEKIMLALGSIGFAIAARSYMAAFVGFLSIVFAFLQYPAATYSLVLAAAVVGAVMFIPRYKNPTTPALLATGFVGAFLLVAFNVELLLRSSGAYFDAIGKINNSPTRLTIYQEVFSRVSEPLFSAMFTKSLSLEVVLSGKLTAVPAHSDVLTMYMGGGLAIATLFVAVFGAAMYAVATSRGQVSSEIYSIAAIMTTIAVGGLFAGLVNPVLLNPTTSVLVFSLLAGALGMVRSGRLRVHSRHVDVPRSQFVARHVGRHRNSDSSRR